ncbi:glycosyltransferase [bacterium]|nr:glycosyltransferase [bacterium]
MSSPNYSPEVSVIIPTYNRCVFIEKAVDSVLNQTYPNIKLIVIDDGSTDSTGKLLSKYGDKIIYIYQQHQGVSYARNAGLKESEGELITFLDSDDLWLPRKIEAQIDHFRENPESKICQVEEIWYRKGIRVNPRKKHELKSGWIFEDCLRICMVSLSAIMFKRELFEDVGYFDESFPVCEDYDYWLRVAYRYPIHVVREKLVVKHGGRGDQLSRQHKGQDKYRIKSILKLLDSGVLNEEQTEQAINELKRKSKIYGEGCIKRGRFEEGVWYLNLDRN